MEIEYSGNSHKMRNPENQEDTEKKEIAKVTRGNVKVRKESTGKKLANTFISDSAGEIKNYIWYDVLVPAIKDTIADMVSNTVNMLFYNTPGGKSSSRSNKPGGSRVSYSSFYKSDDRDRRPRSVSRDRHSINDIIFDRSGDAREALNSMIETLDHYKVLSVSDYYGIVGAEDIETYTDRNFGWVLDRNGNNPLDDVHILRDRDGYLLDLPRPEPLD